MDTSKIIAMTRGKPAPERLYFRVGHNDHLVLEELLAASRMRADGLLFDARRHQRHESLRQQANQADVATRAADIEESFRKTHRRLLSMKEMLVDLRRAHTKRRPTSVHRPMVPGASAKIIPLAPREPRGR